MKYYPGDGYKTVYKEGLMVGYRHFDTNHIQPQFEFGFGLSYTSFNYSDPVLERQGENVLLSFHIKNTGTVAGAEAAQVYIRPENGWLSRPEKELKGFHKVYLQPGETKSVIITLEPRSFMCYNITLKDWYNETDRYQILIGASSRDIRLQLDYHLNA
jgi:beta-glucosidase